MGWEIYLENEILKEFLWKDYELVKESYLVDLFTSHCHKWQPLNLKKIITELIPKYIIIKIINSVSYWQKDQIESVPVFLFHFLSFLRL